jgi:hypothetical protein
VGWKREEAGDAFDLKCEEWEERDWMTWLAEYLVCPFKATREEDMEGMDDAALKPKIDKNYWPVREYVVWFANR